MTMPHGGPDSFFGDGGHMTDKESDNDNPWDIDPASTALLDQPLDFLAAEHHRQRQAALVISIIADGEFDQAGVTGLIAFLEKDFAQHVADEELGLFPLLREHCKPKDQIDKLLARLAEEHQNDETINDDALVMLRELLTKQKLPKHRLQFLRNFAEHIRQHLAVENAVMLPIARVRLDGDALATLSRLMKDRRKHR